LLCCPHPLPPHRHPSEHRPGQHVGQRQAERTVVHPLMALRCAGGGGAPGPLRLRPPRPGWTHRGMAPCRGPFPYRLHRVSRPRVGRWWWVVGQSSGVRAGWQRGRPPSVGGWSGRSTSGGCPLWPGDGARWWAAALAGVGRQWCRGGTRPRGTLRSESCAGRLLACPRVCGGPFLGSSARCCRICSHPARVPDVWLLPSPSNVRRAQWAIQHAPSTSSLLAQLTHGAWGLHGVNEIAGPSAVF
jgi:hypothetical protein